MIIPGCSLPWMLAMCASTCSCVNRTVITSPSPCRTSSRNLRSRCRFPLRHIPGKSSRVTRRFPWPLVLRRSSGLGEETAGFQPQQRNRRPPFVCMTSPVESCGALAPADCYRPRPCCATIISSGISTHLKTVNELDPSLFLKSLPGQRP